MSPEENKDALPSDAATETVADAQPEAQDAADEGSFDKDSIGNIILMTLGVCLVCSVLVSGAAVALKPQQTANKLLDQQQNVLWAAGVLPDGQKRDAEGRGIAELFEQFEVAVVDLRTGEFAPDAVDPQAYEQVQAAKDPSMSTDLDASEDVATIGRREHYGEVYILRGGDGGIEKLVLPVRGYGLWGTLFGYLALEGDLKTVAGLGFYKHQETPGLGGEVDNQKWKAQWPGTLVYDESWDANVSLVKQRSPAGSDAAQYEIDSLSGATLTSRGVENLVNFWVSDSGYGRFIDNLRKGGAA